MSNNFNQSLKQSINSSGDVEITIPTNYGSTGSASSVPYAAEGGSARSPVAEPSSNSWAPTLKNICLAASCLGGSLGLVGAGIYLASLCGEACTTTSTYIPLL